MQLWILQRCHRISVPKAVGRGHSKAWGCSEQVLQRGYHSLTGASTSLRGSDLLRNIQQSRRGFPMETREEKQDDVSSPDTTGYT